MTDEKVDPREYWESCFEHIDAGTYDFLKSKPAPSLITFCDKHLEDGAAVLDLGCGGGRNAQYLAQRGYKVYGVDIAAAAVEFCQKCFARYGLTGIFKKGTFDQIPFPDAFFSGVICIAALDHVTLEVAQQAVLEIRRVLADGGLVHFTFDPLNTDEERLSEAEVMSDGTLKFTRGKQKGMLFRRYRDVEILSLLGEKSILSFDTSNEGTRVVVTR